MSDEAKEVIAYQIWEEQGRPHGRDAEHWQEAERRPSAPAMTELTKAAALQMKPSTSKRTTKSKAAANPKEKAT